jgi:PAS domain S-box-containing protein
VSGIARDVTERKRAEDALRESEEKFRNVFRDAGVGMVVVSPEGRFLAANKVLCDRLGYTEEELLKKTVESITFPADWPAFSQKLGELITEGRGFQCFEKRCLHKSGRIVHTENSASVIRSREGDAQYLVGHVLDITERKEAEEAISTMTRKLIEAQEQERARIGRELHDDINQRLAMLALELEQLRDNPAEVGGCLQELRKQTIELSNDVQALSHELHSSKLEYLGAVAGIKSWCREFGDRQRMEIEFKSNVAGVLPVEVGVCLFRVLQEALHNAVKYCGTKRVEVQLAEHSNEIHLVVRDSGRGFDIEAATQGRGLGLTSMQERVRLVSGTISIESKPMGGTSIHVRVPVELGHQSQRAAG